MHEHKYVKTNNMISYKRNTHFNYSCRHTHMAIPITMYTPQWEWCLCGKSNNKLDASLIII